MLDCAGEDVRRLGEIVASIERAIERRAWIAEISEEQSRFYWLVHFRLVQTPHQNGVSIKHNGLKWSRTSTINVWTRVTIGRGLQDSQKKSASASDAARHPRRVHPGNVI